MKGWGTSVVSVNIWHYLKDSPPIIWSRIMRESDIPAVHVNTNPQTRGNSTLTYRWSITKAARSSPAVSVNMRPALRPVCGHMWGDTHSLTGADLVRELDDVLRQDNLTSSVKSNILVINVTIKLLHREIWRFIFSLYVKKRYSCNQCYYQATQKVNLKTHIQSVHKKIKYQSINWTD